MKRMKDLRWGIEILIRAFAVLEIIWIGNLVILKTSLVASTSLLIFTATLLCIPLIQKLQQKWPLVYHVIGMGILVAGIWTVTGFSLFLGCVLVVVAIFGSFPQAPYGRLLLLYPMAYYLAGYLLNAVPIRLMALLLALLMVISHQLMTWLTEMTAAQTLSKAVIGRSNGGLLAISHKQLLLMLGGLAVVGLTFVALLAWLQPFDTFVYTSKEMSPSKETIQSQAPIVDHTPNPSHSLESMIGKSEPNQLLVKFWALLEQILKVLLVLAGLLLFFYIGFQMLHYLRLKRQPEKVEELPETADFVLLDRKASNKTPRFTIFGDYNQQVRQRFKKEIRQQTSVSATPRELATALADNHYTQLLLTLYEKARYDEKAVTKEEWQALKAAKKENCKAKSSNTD